MISSDSGSSLVLDLFFFISIQDADYMGSPMLEELQRIARRRAQRSSVSDSTSVPKSSSPITVMESMRSRMDLDRYGQDGGAAMGKESTLHSQPEKGSTLSK